MILVVYLQHDFSTLLIFFSAMRADFALNFFSSHSGVSLHRAGHISRVFAARKNMENNIFRKHELLESYRK